jgi:hypothetical protein
MSNTIIERNAYAAAIIAAFFDGRTFGRQCPQVASPDYRTAATRAIEEYAQDVAADEAGYAGLTDLGRGENLYRRIQQRYDETFGGGEDFAPDTDQKCALGAMLREIGHNLGGTMLSTIHDVTIPESAPEGVWRAVMAEWVADDTADVQPNVDLQATRTAAWRHAPEGWRATADGKRLLSELMFAKTKRLYPIDSKVTVQNNDDVTLGNIGIPSDMEGNTETVAEVYSAAGQPRVRLRSDWYVLPVHLVRDGVHPVNTTSDDTTTGEEDRIAELERQLAEAKDRHAEDIERIGEVFWSEAKSREWCSEAESVISGLNYHLNVSLPETRPVSVWDVKVESSDYSCGYVLVSGVEASDEDEAADKVRTVMRQALRIPDFREQFSQAAATHGLAFSHVDEQSLDLDLDINVTARDGE